MPIRNVLNFCNGKSLNFEKTNDILIYRERRKKYGF